MNIHQPQAKAKTLDRLPERLHHFGFVVKDQEVNRQFFEDVLGIPLVATWCERAHNVVGRPRDQLLPHLLCARRRRRARVLPVRGRGRLRGAASRIVPTSGTTSP